MQISFTQYSIASEDSGEDSFVHKEMHVPGYFAENFQETE